MGSEDRPIDGVVIRTIEKLVARFSFVGDSEFFDPALFPWVNEIEANWRDVREELDDVLRFREAIPNFQDISAEQYALTNDDRWKTFFFYAYGVKIEPNCRICPRTAELLTKIPGMTTAFFSILLPHKHLPAHCGPYKGVLRYHLGLKVPDPASASAIKVGSKQASWQEGKSLIFDDTFVHEAWNSTPEIRVVLFVDFLRPLPFPISVLNKLFIAYIRSSPLVQDGLPKVQKWNKRFEEIYSKSMK
jgi:ornithine lipid ester-linked acyl 2-hydroxylase